MGFNSGFKGLISYVYREVWGWESAFRTLLT